MSARRPVCWLNYRGDVTAFFAATPYPMGPNTMGEALWPVEWEYDPETDRTRVGFSLIAPPLEEVAT